MAIEQFIEVAHRIVWCTMATVDPQGRPRSRVVHPVWEREGSAITGWVVSRRTPLRRRHLEHSGFVSCSYWDPQHDTAVAECAAAWLTEAGRARAGLEFPGDSPAAAGLGSIRDLPRWTA